MAFFSSSRLPALAIIIIAVACFLFKGWLTPIDFNEDLIDDGFDSVKIQMRDLREAGADGVLDLIRSKEVIPAPPPRLSSAVPLGSNTNYAYVSLICDDGMESQAMSLSYAMKRSKTLYPLIFLTAPSVSDKIIRSIEKLGALTRKVEQTKGKDRADCLYSKLATWKMTEYDKIVFLDAGLLIVNVHHFSKTDSVECR